MKDLDHIFILVGALVLVLCAYIALVLIHGTNPKLMDGVLILIGGIAAAAKASG